MTSFRFLLLPNIPRLVLLGQIVSDLIQRFNVNPSVQFSGSIIQEAALELQFPRSIHSRSDELNLNAIPFWEKHIKSFTMFVHMT